MPRTRKKLNEVIDVVNKLRDIRETDFHYLRNQDKTLETKIDELKDILKNLCEYLDVEVKKVQKQEEHYEIVPKKKKTNGRKA